MSRQTKNPETDLDRRAPSSIRNELLAATMTALLLAACASQPDPDPEASQGSESDQITEVVADSDQAPQDGSPNLGEFIGPRLESVNERLMDFINSHENTPSDPVSASIVEDAERGEVTYMVGRQTEDGVLSINLTYQMGEDGTPGGFMSLNASRISLSPTSSTDINEMTVANIYAPGTFSERPNDWVASGGTHPGSATAEDFDFSTVNSAVDGFSAIQHDASEVLGIAGQLVSDTIASEV